GDCHYLDGNLHAEVKILTTQELLDYAGIGRQRLHLRWISSAEGQRFAETVSELTELVSDLGPLDTEHHRTALEAALHTLDSENVRWLLGMQRELTEKQNVYGEKVDSDAYKRLLQETLRNQYQKSLIRLSLREGPLSVREIDSRINIGTQDVASLVLEMENQGQVELHGYEGRTPKFAGTTT
ncbi:MAG: hydrogenase iron-sulfur subunit, partial [Syntrophobacteria bacterium]